MQSGRAREANRKAASDRLAHVSELITR